MWIYGSFRMGSVVRGVTGSCLLGMSPNSTMVAHECGVGSRSVGENGV